MSCCSLPAGTDRFGLSACLQMSHSDVICLILTCSCAVDSFRLLTAGMASPALSAALQLHTPTDTERRMDLYYTDREVFNALCEEHVRYAFLFWAISSSGCHSSDRYRLTPTLTQHAQTHLSRGLSPAGGGVLPKLQAVACIHIHHTLCDCY